MNKYSKNQKGLVAIIVAILMVVLIAFLGLAVDSGFMLMKRGQLQNVADAAALSCVINHTAPTVGCGDGTTQQTNLTVTTNDYIKTVNPDGYVVVATYPYVAPTPYASPAVSKCLTTANGCAKAVVTTTFKPFFMSVLGFSSGITISATAVALGTVKAPTCITTTGSFSINGNNTINLNNCSMAVGGAWSSVGKSAVNVNGSGSTTVYNTSTQPTCGGTCTPSPTTNINPLPTQPTYATPSVSPAVAPTCVASLCTYSPGSYAAAVTLPNNTSAYFLQGVYVFNNGLTLDPCPSCSVTNQTSGVYPAAVTGVSLYVAANKTLSLSGNIALNAPSSVGCANSSSVVLSQPLGSPPPYNNLTFGGTNGTMSLTGITSLPGANLTLNGTQSYLNIAGSLLVHNFTDNGNMNPTVSNNPCNNLYNTQRIILVQ